MQRRSRRFHLVPWSVLLLAAAGIVAHARYSARPIWSVETVTVEGNRSIQTGDLLELLGLRPGLPWWQLDRPDEDRLRRSCPRLGEVGYAWQWPRGLHVRVRERESVVRTVGPSPMEIAADGIVLDPREWVDPADLPILTGAVPSGLVPGDRCVLGQPDAEWSEILQLAVTEPETWRLISEIHYVSGSEFHLCLRRGHRVVLWETGIHRDPGARLGRVLEDLDRQGLADAVVDLRFRDQVVVRPPLDMQADSLGASGRARKQGA